MLVAALIGGMRAWVAKAMGQDDRAVAVAELWSTDRSARVAAIQVGMARPVSVPQMDGLVPAHLRDAGLEVLKERRGFESPRNLDAPAMASAVVNGLGGVPWRLVGGSRESGPAGEEVLTGRALGKGRDYRTAA